MRKFLFIGFLFLVGYSYTQTGTITDARDEKVYKTVVIGLQTWMSENLNVSTFRNGDVILEAKTKEEWENAGKNKQPAWCYYDNDPKNGAKYGKLYNWYAVNDPRGLAPIGYHIPSHTEWKSLIEFLEGVEKAGYKMKSKSGWYQDGNGGNTSGFTGLPGGFRNYDETFYLIGRVGIWWSSTESNTYNAWGRQLTDYQDDIIHVDNGAYIVGRVKGDGLSVRCIKDK